MTPFLFFWLTSHQSIAEPWFSLEGYGEFRSLYFSRGHTQWQTVERIRPTVSISAPYNIVLESTFDISWWQGRDDEIEKFFLLKTPIENAVPPTINGNKLSFEEICTECGWDLRTTSSWYRWQYFFDRLHITIPLPFADIRIGRQALHWGSALLINPTDMVPQTLAQTPWQERKGVDALRISVPLIQQQQEWGQINLIALQDQIGTQFQLFQNTWDASVVGIIHNNQQQIGLNIRGESTVGWWGEASYFHNETPYWKANIGIDYTFPIFDRLWLFAQIIHDSSGQIPALYSWNQRSYGIYLEDCPALNLDLTEAPPLLRDTLGKWYSLIGLQLSIHDAWKFKSMYFINLADYTGIHSQMISFSLKRFEGTIAFQQRWGTQGEFNPPALQSTFLGTDINSFIPSWRIISWLRFYY